MKNTPTARVTRAGAGKAVKAPAPIAAQHPRSTPDRVADAISKGILMRRFTVGQRLVEADLTRDLGVSRSTVREALRILASSGVVDLTPHRGAVIRSLDHEDAASLLGVLEVLTGLAARLAAANIQIGNNAKRFEAAAQKLIKANTPEALDRVLDERANYYKVMFDIANSGELNRVLPQARAHLFRAQFYQSLTTADLRSMVAEYRAITEAILEGDQAKAEARTRKHLQKTGERTLPRMTAFSLA
ncbi:GntR family transcriptional regulator [Variovorax sp. LG9.2]|uniref:GntR family transcriptional regulator n=1 Tax=Variovorax sp. LG9.2 TaxID=3048626 RepID=UPI002B22FAED|nr:GntR family transcriptional regulator [Variovorax sp. LG9.2]MEB0055922.1 GntR family transcriptional regulator [Variovorax sp. LG9.2]